MSDTGSISSGIAVRYATAVFELAKEDRILPALEKDIAAMAAVLEESIDLRDLISNPVYTRDEMTDAVGAIGKKMKLSPIVVNTLGLMAKNRRLFVLPQLLASVSRMIDQENGALSAEVTAARKLTAAQHKELAKTLSTTVGKKIRVNVSVDESLIGGLIVKVGSKMIDSSIKSKLSSLQNAMKEVG